MKVFKLAASFLKVVSNVQDITITRHTQHPKTYTTHHKKKKHRKHTNAEKKKEKVIIVHGHMIKVISVY